MPTLHAHSEQARQAVDRFVDAIQANDPEDVGMPDVDTATLALRLIRAAETMLNQGIGDPTAEIDDIGRDLGAIATRLRKAIN